ncbi:MAG TPA: hypothetical protein VN730_14825, partial [Steroidobacteraceae bacterium]|nr:hypothetical protein [Steroidobacteraceae bacterium]
MKLSNSGPPACPGIPAFETGEAFDCGEALHVMGVDHSVLARNAIYANAGGILCESGGRSSLQFERQPDRRQLPAHNGCSNVEGSEVNRCET